MPFFTVRGPVALPAAGGSSVTWNDADSDASISYDATKLIATATAAAFRSGRATVSASSGVKFFEITVNTDTVFECVGIANGTASLTQYIGQNTNGFCYANDGGCYLNGAPLNTVATYTAGDVVGFLTNLTAMTADVYKNGVLLTTLASIDISALGAGPFFPAFSLHTSAGRLTGNFAPASPPGGTTPWT